MRITLIQPPDELHRILGPGRDLVQRFEPLGILYIASVLREEGHAVSVIDAHAENLSLDAVLARVTADPPGVVGVSVLTCSGAVAWDLGREFRRRLPGTCVVLGNVHASVFADAYLSHGCCDVVVHGEGERVMADLARRLASGEPLDGLPGTSQRAADGTVVRSGPPGRVDDLSALPFPARDLVPSHLYGISNFSNQVFVERGGARARTMSTSRGCPHRCTFCVVHGDRRPRYNGASRVADEMEMLEREHGVPYVFFDDPLFLADRRRMLDLCAEIRRRGLSMRWGGPAHVRHVDPELVRAMAAAGCHDLSFGVESASQRLLDAVRKRTTPAMAAEAIATVKRHSDIAVEGLFILGLPGETRDESLATIRLACDLPLDMAQFSLFTPYPGSAAFEDLARRGEIDTGLGPGGAVDPSVWRRYAQYVMFEDVQPIWVTPGRTAAELREVQKKALRDFYLRPSQLLRHARRLRPANALAAARILWKGLF